MLILMAILTVGCAAKNDYQAPPIPAVTVAKPIQRTVTVYLEETGTTEAVDVVDVRARVRGFLEKIEFEPGNQVKKGQILYQIEPKQYEAAVAAATADLSAANVNLKKAQIEFERQERLMKSDATSESAFVATQAARDEASAKIAAAQATLDQANLNLSYTQVAAPISGRVGKTLVKEGNLVDGAEATHLTTIIQYDPIFVNFNINESQLLKLMKPAKDRNAEGQKFSPPLYLRRANDEGFPFEGKGDYADLAVDQSTGTFLVRGIFPNPDEQILPGLFVRVRLPVSKLENALLVPEVSILTDQTGKYLFVVDDKDVVQRRSIKVGPKEVIRSQPFVVIEEGLSPDDRVVVNGIQRARPEATVKATDEDLNQQLTDPVTSDAPATEKPESTPQPESTPTKTSAAPGTG